MKFSSLAATSVALTCLLTTVSAKIGLAAPSNPVSGGSYTVTWTYDASDPDQFTLMLQLASDSWATGRFWEFTKTNLDQLDVTFLNTYPYVIMPKPSIYRLTARNQSNVDQVYSQSQDFQFLAAGSVVTTPSTSTTQTIATTSTSATHTVTTSQSSTIALDGTTITTSSSTSVATTSTPSAIQQTNTNPSQTSTAKGEQTSGASGNNTNAAEMLLVGEVFVWAVVAPFAAGLAFFFQL